MTQHEQPVIFGQTATDLVVQIITHIQDEVRSRISHLNRITQISTVSAKKRPFKVLRRRWVRRRRVQETFDEMNLGLHNIMLAHPMQTTDHQQVSLPSLVFSFSQV